MATKQKTSLFTHRLISFAMAVSVTGAIALGLLLAGLFDSAIAQDKHLPDINGVWTEQDVAPYAADSFEIRPEGVFVNGRQVNTQYQWMAANLSICVVMTFIFTLTFLAG